MIGLGVVLGAVVAYGWTVFGGFARDADRYGRIDAPGAKTVTLPAGRIPLDHDDLMQGGGDTRSLADAPAGLRVRVTPKGGGKDLPVASVPGWLFTSSSGDRGHEPFARVDVPESGRYTVRVRADEGSTARIVVGASPWTPFGSVAAGAALAFLVVPPVVAIPGLLARRLIR